MDDKSYTIYQVMEIIKNNKELIFEIRDEKEKDGWYDYMILIPCIGVTSNNYFLKYYVHYKEDEWEVYPYIPLSEKIEWYISPFSKKDIEKSIKIYGIRS